MIRQWIVTEPRGKRKGCIIGLPGRQTPAHAIDDFCEDTGLIHTLRISLEPEFLQWYPMPNGVCDQDAALYGLEAAKKLLMKTIRRIQSMWNLKRNEIALVGHSAGAVMALQVAAEISSKLAGVVSMAGAILKPDDLPPAKHDTPILLRHNQDDDCFEWFERYLPMRYALRKNGYNVFTHEEPIGGHGVRFYDALLVGRFLGSELGYSDNEVQRYQRRPGS